MAMIKCRNCGRNISDTEKVCPYCEEKIEKKVNCPKCGSEKLDFSLVGKTSVFECEDCRYKFSVNEKGDIRDHVDSVVEDFNIFTAFIAVYKKMFRFKGRARRKEYWLANLGHMIVLAIWYALLTIFMFMESDAVLLFILLWFLYGLPTGIGMLAMQIRRLHDTGRPWYSIFVAYIPLVGEFILLYYTIEDSEFGPNEYGPNPKGQG